MPKRSGALVAILLLLPTVLVGQGAPPVTPAFGSVGPVASVAGAQAVASRQMASRTGAGAFMAETLGATAGSLVGFGLVYLGREACTHPDELACAIRGAALGIGASTVGAVLGDHLAGRAAGSDPSTLGAALGAVVGAAAGVGAWHLFTEELDITNEPAVAILAYSLTQGLLTAAGSRIAHRLR